MKTTTSPDRTTPPELPAERLSSAPHINVPTRRGFLAGLSAGAAALLVFPGTGFSGSEPQLDGGGHGGAAVIPQTPNGSTIVPTAGAGGVKKVTLTASVVQQTLLAADGKAVVAKAYGYNGSSPGPTLVFYEGDSVEITVVNNLPEATTVHWHGVIVPNSQDGAPDVGQPGVFIQPGQTYTYKYRVQQVGTHMYHGLFDGAKQEMLGLAGGLIFLPRGGDRSGVSPDGVSADYIYFLHEWDLPQALMPEDIKKMPRTGSSTDTVNSVNDQPNWGTEMQNFFTMNGKAFPSTAPIDMRLHQRIRVRFFNVGLRAHPMHLHGQDFYHTEQDGNPIMHPMKLNTLVVAPGQTVAFEMEAINPGIWPLHCHIAHHSANNLSSGFGGMATVVRIAP